MRLHRVRKGLRKIKLFFLSWGIAENFKCREGKYPNEEETERMVEVVNEVT